MKKILSLFLSVIMIVLSFGICVTASQVSQPSPDDWAIEFVQKADKLGITDSDTAYNYCEAINREEFCNLVYNFIANVIKAPVPKPNNNFTDVSSVKVNVLCDLGIINGKADGIFAPCDFLTREEAAVITSRLINSLMPVAVTEMYFVYGDESLISPWAINPVQTMSNMNVMLGTGNNNFSPQQVLTFQEVIVILARVANIYNQNYSTSNSFTDNFNSYMPKDKNYMFSPVSIKMALALAANGASGHTKAEILKTLKISDLDEYNNYSKNLIEKYSKAEHLKLNIANSIWINSDNTNQQFSDEYKSGVSDFYGAEAKSVNNSNAVKEINSWVNDKTNGKIPTVINSPDFWASLVNAVYFKGIWKNDFNVGATQKAQFTSADGNKADIDFMNKTSWMNIYISSDASIAELPYKNRFDNFSDDGSYIGTDTYNDLDVSMYLVMTNSSDSPEAIINNAVANGNLQSTYTKFSMPKFKFDYSTSLNNILQSMGIKDAFSHKDADFTKMFNSGTMFITDVIHKTYISVDEEGTEAAAVTAIMMAGSALPPEPVELSFNKPFYFIIRDNSNGESLFVGRYAFA